MPVRQAGPAYQCTILAAQQQESEQVECSSDGLCMLQQPSGIPPAQGMTLPEQPGQGHVPESGLQIPCRQGTDAAGSAQGGSEAGSKLQDQDEDRCCPSWWQALCKHLVLSVCT